MAAGRGGSVARTNFNFGFQEAWKKTPENFQALEIFGEQENRVSRFKI
jgi:hypothetical protein